MSPAKSVQVGKHRFSAVQLSSFILKSLKADAEAFLKTEVERAVITVPAYFNNQQRQATIEAGKLAGFKVERIVNEPTAAALAYGVHETDAEKTIAVFDLGGGTFDISIVDFFEGAVEVRASAGEAILGGEDFTRSLARTILAKRSVMFEHAEIKMPAMVSRLVQQCEKAKRSLSKNESTEILLPDDKGNLNADGDKFTVDRKMLMEACGTLLERIGIPVRRAMGDAKIKRQDLDQVILVGGATRMPLIIKLAKEYLGQHPSGYFLPIINRNTVIPTSRSHSLATLSPNQVEVSLNVYQGEGRMVKDNLLLGELKVKGIPRGPAGQEIEVRFTYDSNGVLEVETTIVKTKKKKRLVITKHAGHLSKKELQNALTAMEKLKIHPREKNANRFMIKRAERLFQELPSMLRDQLDMYLDVFESALDSQDPNEIESVRSQLEMFLSVHDPVDDSDDHEDV